MSIFGPRSVCPRCLKVIPWYDNLPVASWLLLGARCRFCRSPISVRYPLVELLTACLLAATVYQHMSRPAGRDDFEIAVAILVQSCILACMIVASFIDIDLRILPDEITITGLLIMVPLGAAFPELHVGSMGYDWGSTPWLRGALAAGIGMAAGGGLLYAVAVLGKLVFRKEAMGFGDVKYWAFLGGYLGAQKIILAFFVACVLGSVFGLIRLFFTRDRYLAFGPFLSLGAGLMIFLPHRVMEILRAIRWE